MVSPSSHRLKVRRSEPSTLPSKLDTASRNIVLSNPHNHFEPKYIRSVSGIRFRNLFSANDRRATEEIRDDLPSERDDGNDDQRQSVFHRYDAHRAPSLFYNKTQPSETIGSPPRVHRKRYSYREVENNKNSDTSIANFPVQAQSNRNAAPRKSNLCRIPLSLSDHETIGDPSLNIYRFRLPNQMLPILDQSKFCINVLKSYLKMISSLNVSHIQL